jgi:hypothetical protein
VSGERAPYGTPPGCAWVVVFDYREDNGPSLVGPFNTRGSAWSWLERQRFDSEAHVAPVAWHDMYLPTQPMDRWPNEGGERRG